MVISTKTATIFTAINITLLMVCTSIFVWAELVWSNINLQPTSVLILMFILCLITIVWSVCQLVVSCYFVFKKMSVIFRIVGIAKESMTAKTNRAIDILASIIFGLFGCIVIPLLCWKSGFVSNDFMILQVASLLGLAGSVGVFKAKLWDRELRESAISAPIWRIEYYASIWFIILAFLLVLISIIDLPLASISFFVLGVVVYIEHVSMTGELDWEQISMPAKDG